MKTKTYTLTLRQLVAALIGALLAGGILAMCTRPLYADRVIAERTEKSISANDVARLDFRPICEGVVPAPETIRDCPAANRSFRVEVVAVSEDTAGEDVERYQEVFTMSTNGQPGDLPQPALNDIATWFNTHLRDALNAVTVDDPTR